MKYQKLLTNLGLTEEEASIYFAALKSEKTLPAHLAKKSGIKRPTLYKIIPGLIKKGLISETISGSRRYFVAEDPQNIFQQKKAEFETLEQLIPGLRSLFLTASVKPKIKVFDGVEGLKKMYMETLKPKEPILEIVSLDNISPEIESHSRNYYIPYRINKRIPIKVLVSGKTSSKLIKLRTASYELREVRSFDDTLLKAPLDCYVYGEEVAFALYRSDSEPAGITIQSKEIAELFKSIFMILWSQAKRVGE